MHVKQCDKQFILIMPGLMDLFSGLMWSSMLLLSSGSILAPVITGSGAKPGGDNWLTIALSALAGVAGLCGIYNVI